MRQSQCWAIGVAFLLVGSCTYAHSQQGQGSTYYVDCSHAASPSADAGPNARTLHSLDQVDHLVLQANDSLLFRRGTTCEGSLQPQGNGFSIGAYGEGFLPRIQARSDDEQALLLNNQEHIHISSLELIGGTTYGLHITASKGTMRSIALQNLTVRDVRGPLKKKASGLVVIAPSSAEATFSDVTLYGVRAYDTTQWSGIFIAGGSQENPATQVQVRNSVVHDVQGDGIVLFNASDSSVRHSVAWHTGMQHQQSIGTPNGIWTWQCTRCEVSESEAFLTDSPGVDGGAFDIDWGNTQNTVRHNYGHDTQGYCVSVFGANGPTSASVIDGNVCINNGQSPRLAQREGAILLMTWNGGSIDGLTISNNLIDWHPAGNTPAIQAGSGLNANHVGLSGNQIKTDAEPMIDPAITFKDGGATSKTPVTPSALAVGSGEEHASSRGRPSGTWRLIAAYPASLQNSKGLAAGALLTDLTSAAVQYRSSRLKLELRAAKDTACMASDWALPDQDVMIHAEREPGTFFMQLVSPLGRVVHSWKEVPSLVDVGLELRRRIGAPDFSKLPFVNVRATD